MVKARICSRKFEQIERQRSHTSANLVSLPFNKTMNAEKSGTRPDFFYTEFCLELPA
jgi:hypothetical protein